VRVVSEPADRQRPREEVDPHHPAPVDVDGVRSVTIGTALWVAAFVVLLAMRDRLVESGTQWWLWTCLAGAGLGLLGLEYTRRRRDAIARVRRYRTENGGPTAADG
jgi:hypothetical protein